MHSTFVSSVTDGWVTLLPLFGVLGVSWGSKWLVSSSSSSFVDVVLLFSLCGDDGDEGSW